MVTKKITYIDDAGEVHDTEEEAIYADKVRDLEDHILDYAKAGGVDSESLAHWILDRYLPRDEAAPLLREYDDLLGEGSETGTFEEDEKTRLKIKRLLGDKS